ncbi:ureidoglycolate lyase [Candidatus Litorirhabdus singularis]|nr:ureidoglycolate lyase [Candidatus Litorirhabdus singularis]
MTEVQIRTLKVETATAAALAPFGVVLGRDENVEPLPIDLYGGAVKVRRIGEFISDEKTEMPVCTLQRRPFEVEYMERHTEHTQTFISLGAKPFIAMFAPPSDSELPDLDQARAFLFDGSAGFMMHLGTWHEFPFALVDDTDLLVILRSVATEGLKSDNVIGNEAVGPDLEKRDMAARFGVKIQLEL